jgi:hypothetical protein
VEGAGGDLGGTPVAVGRGASVVAPRPEVSRPQAVPCPWFSTVGRPFRPTFRARDRVISWLRSVPGLRVGLR